MTTRSFAVAAVVITVLPAVWLCPCVAAEDDAVVVSTLELGLQYAAGFGVLSFSAVDEVRLLRGESTYMLPSGSYTVTIGSATPAKQRFHVFTKTFAPEEAENCEHYVQEWRQRGYDAQVLVFGARLEVAGGRQIDNRRLWASVARCDSEVEAEALLKNLGNEDIWAWHRPETIHPGEAEIVFSGLPGGKTVRTTTPLEIECASPLAVKNVDRGFWRELRGDFHYAAPLTLEVGADALLELRGQLPLEDYLAGVLPAEMSHTWPAAALGAQAIAARSEVLANFRGKHRLEGFDFCAREHCRAFKGQSAYTLETDAALATTRGEVIVADGRIVPTVFSANCGGWTESNEHVWSGPVNPVLRGVADFPGEGASPQARGLWRWITNPPEAYCAIDKRNFRWTRRITATELTKLVNKVYHVGRVRAIRPGGRGLSGRLTSIAVTGDSGSETIRKELAIRQAFGGLPSACFVVSPEGPKSAPTAFVFRGAGYGHGVGMCQHGARGMAARGATPHAILKHYFTGITIERLL